MCKPVDRSVATTQAPLRITDQRAAPRPALSTPSLSSDRTARGTPRCAASGVR